MLELKSEPYYTLSDGQVDTLVQEHFKKPRFNCVVNYEWSNDSQHTGTVDIKDLEDQDGLDYEGLQEFINHPDVPSYPVHWSTLLAELARLEKIPEGNYIIEVCW